MKIVSENRFSGKTYFYTIAPSISMVQCKVMKQLEFIEQRKFDDEDIKEDIEFLKERMEASLIDLR